MGVADIVKTIGIITAVVLVLMAARIVCDLHWLRVQKRRDAELRRIKAEEDRNTIKNVRRFQPWDKM